MRQNLPDIVVANAGPLASSEEFRFGLRQLLARIPHARLWRVAAGEPLATLPRPAQWLRESTAELVLAFIEPAVIVSSNLAVELEATLQAGADCAMPDDVRSSDAPPIDYSTLASFDAYAARLVQRPRFMPWDGRQPLLYMIRRPAIYTAVAIDENVGWEGLPALCHDVRIAQQAWVHDWSYYRRMRREKMLALLPATVTSLLDVGGGEGGFVEAFLASRNGVADLLEPSNAAITAAARGLSVIRQRLGEGALPRRYDAVSMLDVLEHLEDPHAALQAAYQALHVGGYLLLSVPNVGHWRVVTELIAGRFDYTPVGVLCITHLRFFVASSLRELLASSGFRIVQWRQVGLPVPPEVQPLITATRAAGLPVDEENLSAEAFHVLAQRD